MIQCALLFLIRGLEEFYHHLKEGLNSRVIIVNSTLYSLTWEASLDNTVWAICLEFDDEKYEYMTIIKTPSSDHVHVVGGLGAKLIWA